MFENDPLFNNDNYCILNVGPNSHLENEEGYCVLDQKELPDFIKLGPWWAESEEIYNIWKSGVYKDLDYVGFSQYDKELRLIRKNIFGKQATNITERINHYIQNKTRAHISMENHNTREMYLMKVLADPTKPEQLVGDGLNCFDDMLNDYNTFFGTQYTIKYFLKRPRINLCSCFLIDVKTFEKMMEFFDWVVQSHKLEVFDPEHLCRHQGILAERYFGVFLMFEYDKSLDLSTIHHYDEGLK